MGVEDQTITVTSRYDRRQVDNEMWPVWEIVITGSWDADDTGDITQAVDINGILQKIILKIPNTDAATAQLKILDNGDNTIFDSGEVAEDATHSYNVSEPLSGTTDVFLEPSAAMGGSGGDIVVTLRGI